MSANTTIEWTEKSWNPVRGCSLCSPGCQFCYAMKQAHRFSGLGQAYEELTRLGPHGPTWTGAIRLVPEALTEPLHWRKPQRIFVNSMSDLFHDDVPDSFIDQVFAVMALTPQHTYQVLTKRAERMRAYMESRTGALGQSDYFDAIQLAMDDAPKGWNVSGPHYAWPLPHVWLGVSVENQHFADERIPLLLQTPAAVRFISYEPALGPIDVRRWLRANESVREHESTGRVVIRQRDGLDWIIYGGESGPGARPNDVAWCRSVKEQVDATMGGAKLFVKQLGANTQDEDGAMHGRYSAGGIKHDFPKLLDRKGGDPEEWPADLRVREFPTSSREAIAS